MATRDRKNSIKALFGEALTPPLETKSQLPAVNSQAGNHQEADMEAPSVQRASSGAIKAMGLALNSLTRDAEEAKALRQAVEAGERIIELEPALIESSFVKDRLTDEEKDDPDFLSLVDSIAESGQHAPILVRPHPENEGRYQVAYGHRRLKAVRRLGRKVKAVVRALSDDELVLAQGKENAERRNLSFIERAFFAKLLVEKGFDRKIVGDALAVQKSELSRLLQVADAVPERYVYAIGPAPKVGRERWMALGQLFTKEAYRMIATMETGTNRFQAATSDERFQLVFNRLMERERANRPGNQEFSLTAPDGKAFAKVSRKGRAMKIEFAADIEASFVDGLSDRLEYEYARYLEEAKRMTR